MKLKMSLVACLLILMIYPLKSDGFFVANREVLKNFSDKSNVIMVASTGRSGSTMLTEQIKKYVSSNKVLKTHLLPPDQKFKGKIIFIFSNPDQAAESALYMSLHYANSFGKNHFYHVETADRDWLRKIKGSHHQTEQENLLSYDALGTYEHLKAWLYTQTEPSKPKYAQILAIKYENLWDDQTIQAIRNFLDIPHFTLPAKRARGHQTKLCSKEIRFRKIYNLGTEKKPRYAAYDDARILWEEAPPFQYLKISHNELTSEES